VLLIVIYGVTFFIILVFQRSIIAKSFYDSIKNLFFALYTFIEFLFFLLIYWQNIKEKTFRIFVIATFSSFVIFQVVYFFSVENNKIDNIPVGIETLIIYTYIFYFFYDRFKNIDKQYIYNHYCFWISIGIMLYLGGSFFFYILGNHIPPKQLENYWYFTYIVEIVKNILFAIALIVYSHHNSKEKIPNQNLPYLDFN